MANPASRFYFPSAIVAKGEREEEEEEEEDEDNEDQDHDQDRKILDLSGVSQHRIEVIESSDEDDTSSDFLLRPSSDLSVPPSPRDPLSPSDSSPPKDSLPASSSSGSSPQESESAVPVGPSQSSDPSSLSSSSLSSSQGPQDKGPEGKGSEGQEAKGKGPEGPGKGQVAAAFIDQLQLPRSSSLSSSSSSFPSSSSSSSSFAQTRSLGSSSSLITDPKSLSSSNTATIDLRLRGVNTGARKAVAMKGQGAMKEVQSRLQFYEAKPVQTLTSLQEVSRIVRNAHSDFSSISRLSSSFRSFCLLSS